MRSRVRRRHVIRFAAIGLIATALPCGLAAAAGGVLDRSFGDDGFAVVEGVTSCLTGEGGCTVGIGVAIERDGAVVVAAGTLEPDCRSRFAIVRLRSGRLDRDFGHAGRVLTRFETGAAIANSVAIAPDGKIVVAGERQPLGPSCGSHIHLGAGDGFALARYHRDGTLDMSFGGDGRIATPFDHDSGAVDVLLQRDGRIVAAGFSAGKVALARYLPDGRLDRSFGRHGKVVTPAGSRSYLELGRATLDSSDRIVVPVTPGCSPCSTLARFTADGRLDRTFGTGGYADVPFRSATAVRTSGRVILVAGRAADGIAVARVTSSGRLDPSFGRNGVVLSRQPAGVGVNDLAVQRQGKIVVLAWGPWGVWRYTLTRLLPNGSLDRSFGSGGVATVELGRGGGGRRVAVQPDGGLVVASMVGSMYPALTVTRHRP